MTNPTKTGKQARRVYPPGLGKSGRRLYDRVIDNFTVDPLEMSLLVNACRTVDIIGQIDEELADMGTVVSGSTGQPRPNPLLGERREQVRLLERLKRSLGLPDLNAKSARPRKTHATRVSHLVRPERREVS